MELFKRSSDSEKKKHENIPKTWKSKQCTQANTKTDIPPMKTLLKIEGGRY